MNRRTFGQSIAAAALATALPSPGSPAPAPQSLPFALSVMLWTVFTDLPFEERLAKVAEAGYSNVELVGEYNKDHWTPADFDRANAARKRLGIQFDATAGLHNGDHQPCHARCLSRRTPTGAHAHGNSRLPGDDRPLRQRCARH